MDPSFGPALAHSARFSRYSRYSRHTRYSRFSTFNTLTALPDCGWLDISLPAAPQEDEPPFNPTWRFRAAFGALAVINLAAALDATTLSVALPIIAKKLGGTAIEAFWSGTSFLLTSTVLQPVCASFSHIFGRKPMLLISLVLFAAGAIICGLCNNFTLMLVGRSVQGVGGGGIIVLTDIIITDIIPLRLRAKWFGIISLMWAIGSVSGPILGGAFAQKSSWRWIFWLNLPFIGIGFPLVVFFLQLHGRSATFKDKLKRVDYIGATIFVGSTTSFLIPLSWGGVSYSWTSWHTMLPMLTGLVGISVFSVWETVFAEEPIIPISVFKSATSCLSYFQTFIHGVLLWSVLYYMPLYFEGVKGYTPIVAGVAAFPETFTVAPMTVCVAIVVQITGHYRWALWTGWSITTVGMGILYLLQLDTRIVEWIFLNLVPGIGLGLLFPAMGFSIQAAAPQKDAAHAVAMFTFFRGLGQSVGVTVGGVIFQNQMKSKLLGYPDLASKAVAYSQDASALVEIIKAMPPGANVTFELKTAYADSLKTLWVVMCGFAALAFLTSFFIKSFSLEQALETEQGFKHERPESRKGLRDGIGGEPIDLKRVIDKKKSYA